MGTDNCDQLCGNSEGSFVCFCDVGYSGGSSCTGKQSITIMKTSVINEFVDVDVNECQASNGGCDHVCNNTVGSFQCSCNSGYILSADGFRCSGKGVNHFLLEPLQGCFCLLIYPDINECEVSNGGCDHICTNTAGSFQCSCNQGYGLGSDGSSCTGKQSTIQYNIQREC